MEKNCALLLPPLLLPPPLHTPVLQTSLSKRNKRNIL